MSSQRTRGGLPVTVQQEAVIASVLANPVTVVSAGAGSGKTHTTVAAVLELLQQQIAEMDQFILITFTNEAADQLRESVEAGLRQRVQASSSDTERSYWRSQQERLSAAYIGTIHSFCRWILRNFGYSEFISHEMDVTMAKRWLEQATTESLKQYIKWSEGVLLGPDMKWQDYELIDFIQRILSEAHNRGLSIERLRREIKNQARDVGYNFRKQVADLALSVDRRYSELKQERQLFDATDLLSKTAALLEGSEGERINSLICQRFTYLFIDEFQDTDFLQKRIVDALLSDLSRLLVVGDRKQSIYRFRGAEVSLIKQIADENGAAVLPLTISRRPTQQLLTAQGTLFMNMESAYPELGELLDPYPDILQPSTSFPPLSYISAGPPGAQHADRIRVTAQVIRDFLASEIEERVRVGEEPKRRQVEAGDIVILLRSKNPIPEYHQRLQQMLQDLGVMVRAELGGTFFEQPEIVSTYHMLRLILHYPDDAVLAAALRTPYLRAIQATVRERELLQYGGGDEYPLTDWFENEYELQSQGLRTLREVVRTDTVPQILSRLYKTFDINRYYLTRANRQAVDNLQKLREMARHLFQEEQALTLREFVNWLQISLETRRAESEAVRMREVEQDRPPYIRITTVHRSKGLQFPIVIIPEIQAPLRKPRRIPDFLLIEGMGIDVHLPHTQQSLDTRSTNLRAIWGQEEQEQVEEEIRIFYVALTRAQQSVVLIGSGRRQPNNRASQYYSWQDEVLMARRQLEAVGAVFRIP